MAKLPYFIRFVSVGVVLAVTSCVNPTSTPDHPVSTTVLPPKSGSLLFLYTSNRQGDMEPCGCTVNQLGGMDRMQNALIREKTNGPNLFVDAGDSFFPAPQLRTGREELEKTRAEYIARAYAEMSLDVLTPGERDFAGGLEELNKLRSLSRARFVASNLTNTKGVPIFETDAVLERGGFRVGVVGLVSPEAYQNVAGVKVSDPIEGAKKTIKELRKKNTDVILVLSHLGLKKDRELAKLDGENAIDVIVGSHSLDALTIPEKVGKTNLVQPMIQGQQLGALQWNVASHQATAHNLVDLVDSMNETNAVSPLMEAFKKEKVRLGGVETTESTTGAHPYVAHPYSCRGCHQPQYEFWSKTKHASAYLALYAKKQNFDPECVSCHTLGFGEPGGFEKISEPAVMSAKAGKVKGKFIDGWMKFIFGDELNKGPLDSRIQPARFKKLQKRFLTEYTSLEQKGFLSKWYVGVQCEHCHGNRDGHPGSANTLKKVDQTSCKNCHTPPNAKVFDPKTIPLVACPLMKK